MTTPIAGNLTEVSASAARHLTVNFFKSQIPQRSPEGEGRDWMWLVHKNVLCVMCPCKLSTKVCEVLLF